LEYKTHRNADSSKLEGKALCTSLPKEDEAKIQVALTK
jgi:hypothetical protein